MLFITKLSALPGIRKMLAILSRKLTCALIAPLRISKTELIARRGCLPFCTLYSIFVNKYRRDQREANTVSIEELEQTFHRTLADPDWQTNFVAPTRSEFDSQEPEVNHALAKLPEDFRSAVLLVDVQGFTYEEAAAALECPVGTLRSRLFRARRMLFLELRDYARKIGFIRTPPI